MPNESIKTGEKVTIQTEGFQHLIDILKAEGYKITGPKKQENAIIYDEISSVDDLPVGWTDEQEKGTYNLKRRNDNALFGYNVGPHSWKKYLHPPIEVLWKAKREKNSFKVINETKEPLKYAFIGVRSCELNAIGIQDKVFLEGSFVNPQYKLLRENVFIVAINCTQAGKTCFCTSMNTGPEVKTGFDLALTEIIDKDEHYFVCEAGSKEGISVLQKLNYYKTTNLEKEKVKEGINKAISEMGRKIDITNIKEKLVQNYDHDQWDKVAQLCLTCTNCTMVCPTCFCTSVEDVTDLQGETTERTRKWDSCFTLDFSYIHGGTVRKTGKSRYRQWLTHKFSTWYDQFGSSGCVGCGRCITWCPVGIDVTEEIKKITEMKETSNE